MNYIKMTRQNLLLLFLIPFTFSACSQNKQFLFGKWKFLDVYDIQNNTHSKTYEEKMWYSKMTFYFKRNNHYKAFIMGENEDGTFEYNEHTNTITLTSNKENVNKVEVIRLTANNLVIRIGQPAFTLERTTTNDEDEMEKPIVKSKSIAVTPEQISKKWTFKNCAQESDSTTAIALALNDAMKGTFYYFKKNGKYEAVLSTDAVDGTWTLGKDHKSIILTASKDKDGSNIWEIKSVTATELILMKVNENDGLSFRFSTLE